MKKKLIYMFLALIVVVGGITAYTASAKAQEIEKRIQTITEKVSGLYESKAKTFLRADVNAKELETIDELIKAETGTKLTEELAGKLNTAIINLDTAGKMLAVKEAVNSLLDENGVLVTGINIEEVKNSLEPLRAEKAEFITDLETIVSNAEEQQAVINQATEQVNSIYNEDGTVKADLTREQLELVTADIANVLPEAIKAELEAKVALANETLTAWEAERAEEARKAEEARQAEAAQKAQASNNAVTGNGSTTSNKSGSNNSSASTNNNTTSGSNNSSSSSNNKASNNGSSSTSGNNSQSSGSGWDHLTPGIQDWNCYKTGEGQIGENNWSGNGNTWESYECSP